jgi:thiosulfate reductase cytochrome b subunit
MPKPASRVPRFPLLTRLTHWLNVVAIAVMIMSGLQIFNAHTALYTGEDADPAHAILSLPQQVDVNPDGSARYEMRLLGHAINPGRFTMTEFPSSVTLGGWLAGGRRVHFAAAWLLLLNGLLYLGHMLATGRWRAVWPLGEDWRGIGPTIRDHLRFPPVLHGVAGAYNPLQRITYALIVLGVVPLVIATGLALSPAWDAILPFWTDLFGGRQAARAWHFGAMAALIAFTIMHVALVALAGWPSLRRMITGRPLPVGDLHVD